MYDDCELLDFAAPFEVFNQVNEVCGKKIFNVFTLATHDRIATGNGLRILPDETFAYSPEIDVLIIPGGRGRDKEMHNERLMYWLKTTPFKYILSVSTGSFILAQSGLLDNKKSTTYYYRYQDFEDAFPRVELVRDVKYVDNGNIICSGGIATGMDMSFYFINRLLGTKIALLTAEKMQYELPLAIVE